MGMYTELVMGIQLKRNAPDDVIEMLNCMVLGVEKPDIVPTHDLFKTNRWNWMFSSSSYYFDGDTHSTLRFDKICNVYVLTVRCDLKNYDSEVEKFLDWIAPYSDTCGFVGYTRYEEDDDPKLIYFNGGKVLYKEAK